MAAEPEPLFTTGQRRVLGTALTVSAALVAAALLVAVFIGLARLLGYFSPVLWPLCAAAVLALILRPVVDEAQRRLKLRRVAAVILLYGIFLLLLTGVLVSVLPPLIDQTLDLIASLPTFASDTVHYMQRNYPQWVGLARRQMAHPLVQQMVEGVSEQARVLFASAIPSLRAAVGGALGLLAFGTHMVIVPVYLFFFLLARDGGLRKLPAQLTFLKDGVRADVVFLVHEFISIVESFFRGQLIIAAIMGVLLALGFSLVGLKFALVIGLGIGVLNVLPYLGTIIGLSLALPLAFFQTDGGWPLVGLVLLVWAIVQACEAWFLTPKIMGARTGLHPAAIIVAIFFWGTAFDSILGMLLAIPLSAFIVTAWRLVKRKYLAPAAKA
jgi:predicted PurR-regulated permease PerM